ncbi:DUF6344 domain-containing protein [Streptomyces sp. HUAS ZL42]|uniref:DUF6344 domain-containing protein n=1 Tax=Streptomyces sp. HUAS ZL42 TaxID=3231715 RepID=UPI00345EDDCC
MTKNQVMKLWTIIVSAFFALCTALGLVTTTAATAVAQTEASRNSSEGIALLTAPSVSPWAWSLPPTMKQRIRAEAHGKSPNCRHRPLTDAEPATLTEASCAPATPAEPATPLRR